MKRLVAKWEARKGKQFISLYEEEGRYTYDGNGCGGSLGKMDSDSEAIQYMIRPWGLGAGAVTVLQSDYVSTKRVI